LGWFLLAIGVVWVLEHVLLIAGGLMLRQHYRAVLKDMHGYEAAMDHLLHGGKLIQDGHGAVLFVAPDTVRNPRVLP